MNELRESRWFHVGPPWSDRAGLVYAGSEDPHAGTFVVDCGTWGDELFFGVAPTADADALADLIVMEHNTHISDRALDEIRAYIEMENHDDQCPAEEWSGERPSCTCGDDEMRSAVLVLLNPNGEEQ